MDAPWQCAACPAASNAPGSTACAACRAPRPLTLALFERFSAADVSHWAASLPGLTPAHGEALFVNEVSGRRLLKMGVPDLVAAGLSAGAAVDVIDALNRVREPSLADRLAAAQAWAGAGLVSAGAVFSGVAAEASKGAASVASSPSLAPYFRTFGQAFAGGLGLSAGATVGTRVSNAALDTLHVGKK